MPYVLEMTVRARNGRDAEWDVVSFRKGPDPENSKLTGTRFKSMEAAERAVKTLMEDGGCEYRVIEAESEAEALAVVRPVDESLSSSSTADAAYAPAAGPKRRRRARRAAPAKASGAKPRERRITREEQDAENRLAFEKSDRLVREAEKSYRSGSWPERLIRENPMIGWAVLQSYDRFRGSASGAGYPPIAPEVRAGILARVPH